MFSKIGNRADDDMKIALKNIKNGVNVTKASDVPGIRC